MTTEKGVVLIIDDQDGRTTKVLLGDTIRTTVRHPNDVVAQDLKKAKLILVDFKLDHWPERDRQETPSLMPKDGVALMAVLRSNLSQLKASPVAFCLNSGMLTDLNGGRSSTGREHAIAQSVDLEWVFSKGQGRETFPVAVSALADAVAALPNRWPKTSETKDKLLSLLKLPQKVRWRQSAIEAIDRSHPPHDIMIGNGSGIAVLRWLLHVILPYPTFLIDERYLAARLRIDPKSFSQLVKGKEGSTIKAALRAFEYKGILSEFAGLRWWRSGLEYWIYQKTNGKSFDRDAIHKLVTSAISESATFTDIQNPVVSLDSELRPSDKLIELVSSIEIKPDGWPSFADGAWIPADLADSTEFVALVPQSEKNKL
ncbi:hypothetical protein AB7813_10250 [Tardiphaga sp. 20_F10_N6_6]|uniref:hypothetical protein n=1 Tax=Tardiphaga sp. 20_F10_N6_6 TaxID=3240788 RepID=UPI003F8BDF90